MIEVSARSQHNSNGNTNNESRSGSIVSELEDPPEVDDLLTYSSHRVQEPLEVSDTEQMSVPDDTTTNNNGMELNACANVDSMGDTLSDSDDDNDQEEQEIAVISASSEEIEGEGEDLHNADRNSGILNISEIPSAELNTTVDANSDADADADLFDSEEEQPQVQQMEMEIEEDDDKDKLRTLNISEIDTAVSAQETDTELPEPNNNTREEDPPRLNISEIQSTETTSSSHHNDNDNCYAEIRHYHYHPNHNDISAITEDSSIQNNDMGGNAQHYNAHYRCQNDTTEQEQQTLETPSSQPLSLPNTITSKEGRAFTVAAQENEEQLLNKDNGLFQDSAVDHDGIHIHNNNSTSNHPELQTIHNTAILYTAAAPDTMDNNNNDNNDDDNNKIVEKEIMAMGNDDKDKNHVSNYIGQIDEAQHEIISSSSSDSDDSSPSLPPPPPPPPLPPQEQEQQQQPPSPQQGNVPGMQEKNDNARIQSSDMVEPRVNDDIQEDMEEVIEENGNEYDYEEVWDDDEILQESFEDVEEEDEEEEEILEESSFIEEEEEEMVVSVSAKSSEYEYADHVIDSWQRMRDEEPDDLETAVIALIAAVYKGKEDEVNVEKMIKRTPLPELYKYLKRQYWYKIHTDQEEAAEAAKAFVTQDPSEVVTVDDMLRERLQGLIANAQETNRWLQQNQTALGEDAKKRTSLTTVIANVQMGSRALMEGEQWRNVETSNSPFCSEVEAGGEKVTLDNDAQLPNTVAPGDEDVTLEHDAAAAKKATRVCGEAELIENNAETPKKHVLACKIHESRSLPVGSKSDEVGKNGIVSAIGNDPRRGEQDDYIPGTLVANRIDEDNAKHRDTPDTNVSSANGELAGDRLPEASACPNDDLLAKSGTLMATNADNVSVSRAGADAQVMDAPQAVIYGRQDGQTATEARKLHSFGDTTKTGLTVQPVALAVNGDSMTASPEIEDEAKALRTPNEDRALEIDETCNQTTPEVKAVGNNIHASAEVITTQIHDASDVETGVKPDARDSEDPMRGNGGGDVAGFIPAIDNAKNNVIEPNNDATIHTFSAAASEVAALNGGQVTRECADADACSDPKMNEEGVLDDRAAECETEPDDLNADGPMTKVPDTDTSFDRAAEHIAPVMDSVQIDVNGSDKAAFIQSDPVAETEVKVDLVDGKEPRMSLGASSELIMNDRVVGSCSIPTGHLTAPEFRPIESTANGLEKSASWNETKSVPVHELNYSQLEAVEDNKSDRAMTTLPLVPLKKVPVNDEPRVDRGKGPPADPLTCAAKSESDRAEADKKHCGQKLLPMDAGQTMYSESETLEHPVATTYVQERLSHWDENVEICDCHNRRCIEIVPNKDEQQSVQKEYAELMGRENPERSLQAVYAEEPEYRHQEVAETSKGEPLEQELLPSDAAKKKWLAELELAQERLEAEWEAAEIAERNQEKMAGQPSNQRAQEQQKSLVEAEKHVIASAGSETATRLQVRPPVVYVADRPALTDGGIVEANQEGKGSSAEESPSHSQDDHDIPSNIHVYTEQDDATNSRSSQEDKDSATNSGNSSDDDKDEEDDEDEEDDKPGETPRNVRQAQNEMLQEQFIKRMQSLCQYGDQRLPGILQLLLAEDSREVHQALVQLSQMFIKEQKTDNTTTTMFRVSGHLIVVDVMRKFHSISDIQVEGCRVIASCCHWKVHINYVSIGGVGNVCIGFAAAGAFECILHALTSFPEHDLLQKRGFRALNNLMSSKHLIPLFYEVGILPVIVGSMQRYPDNLAIQEDGCRIMRFACNYPSAREKFKEVGAMAILGEVLERFDANSRTGRQAMKALHVVLGIA